jgi:hypothetical protein
VYENEGFGLGFEFVSWKHHTGVLLAPVSPHSTEV